MARQLKFHEKKLLKKVDFVNWKQDNAKANSIIKKFHLTKQEDYFLYNKIVGKIHKLTNQLSLLPAGDIYRKKHEKMLIDKLFKMGLLTDEKASPSDIMNKLTVSALCRRRLAYIVFKTHMAETIFDAVKFIEQGHVKVGHNLINDPSYLITRSLEDYVTWTDNSKIKKVIKKYRNEQDDF